MKKYLDWFWKHQPFNNEPPALYFIWGFIVAVIIFLALSITNKVYGETWLEGGVTFAGGTNTNGSAIFFSEVWDNKYLLGFGLVGNQHRTFNVWGIEPGKAVPVRFDVGSNMVVHAQRLITYRAITLGLGVAGWQHKSRILGDTFTFSLFLAYQRPEKWWGWLPNDIRYRHFSNGGTASPNAGQDLLLLSWRF